MLALIEFDLGFLRIEMADEVRIQDLGAVVEVEFGDGEGHCGISATPVFLLPETGADLLV